MIRLFISHSSHDVELTTLVAQLLSTALGLRASSIRCTSVDGYRLPGGADTDTQLRQEALAADAFVGIVSPQSLESAYVLFELGARWGAQRHLAPLLGPGMRPHALRGPLAGLNALSCENASDLHQLVHEIGKHAGAEPEPPAVYQRHIEAIVYFATTQQTPAAPSVPENDSLSPTGPPPRSTSALADDEYAEAEAVIEQHCEREWPDDFSMRAYCIEQQQQAVAELRRGCPADIPESVFREIRRKCAREWPDDYSMRKYSEEQQVTAYRKLHARKRP
jgi:hypothetical protein